MRLTAKQLEMTAQCQRMAVAEYKWGRERPATEAFRFAVAVRSMLRAHLIGYGCSLLSDVPDIESSECPHLQQLSAHRANEAIGTARAMLQALKARSPAGTMVKSAGQVHCTHVFGLPEISAYSDLILANGDRLTAVLWSTGSPHRDRSTLIAALVLAAGLESLTVRTVHVDGSVVSVGPVRRQDACDRLMPTIGAVVDESCSATTGSHCLRCPASSDCIEFAALLRSAPGAVDLGDVKAIAAEDKRLSAAESAIKGVRKKLRELIRGHLDAGEPVDGYRLSQRTSTEVSAVDVITLLAGHLTDDEIETVFTVKSDALDRVLAGLVDRIGPDQAGELGASIRRFSSTTSALVSVKASHD